MGWATTYAAIWHRLDSEECAEYERMLDKDFPNWDRDGGLEIIAALEAIAEDQRKQGNRRPEPARYPRIKTAIIQGRYARKAANGELSPPPQSCAFCGVAGLVQVWPDFEGPATMHAVAGHNSLTVPCLCSLGQRAYEREKSFYNLMDEPTRQHYRDLARLGIRQNSEINTAPEPQEVGDFRAAVAELAAKWKSAEDATP